MMDDVIPNDVLNEILNRLTQIEGDYNIKILLAIESGSRAWGFPSPNSDYDVRFIYMHREPNYYLSLNLSKLDDQITLPIVDEIDLVGWDICKALSLFYKSNPSFMEWINSPIIYIQSGSFLDKVKELSPEIYSKSNGIHHYKNLALVNYTQFIEVSPETKLVETKKYLYILRALLSVRWIEIHNNPPPIEFQKLLHLLPNDENLINDINILLERKKKEDELGTAEYIPSLNNFISNELSRLKSLKLDNTRELLIPKSIDNLFMSIIKERQ